MRQKLKFNLILKGSCQVAGTLFLLLTAMQTVIAEYDLNCE